MKRQITITLVRSTPPPNFEDSYKVRSITNALAVEVLGKVFHAGDTMITVQAEHLLMDPAVQMKVLAS